MTHPSNTPTVEHLLATLATIPASEAARIGKLHAWLPSGERVFFVWNGRRYQVRGEGA